MSIENSGSDKNSAMEIDLQSSLQTLISNNQRTLSALNIILRELAEMRAKNNDLMGDGQTLNADEIYRKFQEEINRNV